MQSNTTQQLSFRYLFCMYLSVCCEISECHHSSPDGNRKSFPKICCWVTLHCCYTRAEQSYKNSARLFTILWRSVFSGTGCDVISWVKSRLCDLCCARREHQPVTQNWSDQFPNIAAFVSGCWIHFNMSPTYRWRQLSLVL